MLEINNLKKEKFVLLCAFKGFRLWGPLFSVHRGGVTSWWTHMAENMLSSWFLRQQRKKGAESQGSLQGLGLNDLASFSWAPFLKGSTVLDINWGPTLQ